MDSGNNKNLFGRKIMIKIALIGYGKMGHLIDDIAKKHNIKIVSKIDPLIFKNDINEDTVADADVCIDFSQPNSVIQNAKKLIELKKNVVIGTTGWFSHLDEIKDIVEKNQTGFIYSSNFSLGMNIFFKIVDYATKLTSKIEDYDIYGLEKHHRQKMDSPSGTAKMLTDIILKNFSVKDTPQFDKVNRKINKNEFHFASIRAGHIFGEHTIGLDSSADQIILSHQLKNRSGLAIGTILAAKWIAHKKGFYNFSEIFENIIL